MGLLARVASKFTRRAAGSHRRRSRTIAPLVQLPSARVAPDYVVAQLREIDPTVDLVYLGLGVWILGSMQPNSHRRKIAERLLENERERPEQLQSMGRYRMARLIREGLRVIDLVDESAINSMKVVRDFRYADWRYRHCADEAFEENLKGSDDETDFQRRLSLLLDYTQHGLPDVWAHVFGGRRSFQQNRMGRQQPRYA
jgi:hypothetical protein